MRQVNWQMLQRIARHLRRRSQRAYRVPEAESVYMHVQKLGLRLL
jgi:RNA-directed DNA polymerase